jgi:hypothetical protein
MNDPPQSDSRDVTTPEPPPGMPRWVKISGIVVGVLILLFLVLRLTGIGGDHGPGRHMSEPEPGSYGSTEEQAAPAATLG